MLKTSKGGSMQEDDVISIDDMIYEIDRQFVELMERIDNGEDVEIEEYSTKIQHMFDILESLDDNRRKKYKLEMARIVHSFNLIIEQFNKREELLINSIKQANNLIKAQKAYTKT